MYRNCISLSAVCGSNNQCIAMSTVLIVEHKYISIWPRAKTFALPSSEKLWNTYIYTYTMVTQNWKTLRFKSKNKTLG